MEIATSLSLLAMTLHFMVDYLFFFLEYVVVLRMNSTTLKSSMKKTLTLLLLLFTFFGCQNQEEQKEKTDFTTIYEKSNKLETATYQEGIAFWKELADYYPQLQLFEYGSTDSGYPLHLAVLSPTQDFNPVSLRDKNVPIFLINNAIHPGEPDGVEASQMIVRDLLERGNLEESLGNTVLAIIPFYNIGGVLNRNSTTRTNQNGPKEYGFRGNAQNYDLNRDFIKADTKNAWAFAELYQEWQPDVFLDTHVSNGADYQHILTNLMTQENKLGPQLGNFLRFKMLPDLNQKMEEKHSMITPYVNVWGTVPDSGIYQFMDSPRYSTGYTALFHSIGFMTETHMLKTFEQRVTATYSYIESLLEIIKEKEAEIKEIRAKEIEATKTKESFVISWKLNRVKFTPIQFMGYEGEMKVSKVTGQELLTYNREKPFTKEIRFYNTYEPDKIISKPNSYVIPQAWGKVIERLKHNNVEMAQFDTDTTIEVAYYTIKDYKSRSSPYEGHYLHYGTEVEKSTAHVSFRKGDYLIKTNQERNRYIIHTLEPEAPDSFFSWNFFDSILQRKEEFSSYVFDAKAAEILANNPALKAEFEELKANDENFAKSNYAQLNFIYSKTQQEEAYMRYPVFRIER